MVNKNIKRIISTILFFLVFSNVANANQSIPKEKEKELAIKKYKDENSGDIDIANAIIIFEKYSNEDSLMLYYLGDANYYNKTRLMSNNKQKGLEYIKESADKGLPIALYSYGEILIDSKEYKEGIEYLKKAALKGEDNAQYVLGKIYYDGKITKQNKSDAFNLLSASSGAGNADAQYYLANIFLEQDNKQLKKKGVFLLMESVNNGNLKSCDILYNIYKDGEIINKNENLYMTYLECSAKNKNKEAMYLLGMAYKNGDGVNQNIKAANYFFKELSKSHHPEGTLEYARYNLSKMIEVKKSILLLENIYKKNIDAAMMLGYVYKDGLFGQRKSVTKSIRYFEAAKNLGSEEAIKEIEILLKGVN